MNRRVLIASAAALLAAAACRSEGDRPDLEDALVARLEAPSERLLWDVTIQVLQHQDFPVGTGLDPSVRTATTGWRNDLQPFRGKGFRERAIVAIEPLGEGRFEVRARVERQYNMDLVRPLDLSYADWKDAPDDREAASAILQALRSSLALGTGAGPG